MCGLQIVKGLKVSLLRKEKTGKTGATLQHSCSSLGERVFSPNAGGVFTRGAKCGCAHFATHERGKQAGMSD